MKAEALLVLFAHGSRDPSWREPFEKLTALIKEDVGPRRVALAFMEFHPPSLEDVAIKAWSEGIRHIRLLPLFLAGGAHVARDIPGQVESIKCRLPELRVDVLAPIGENLRLQALLRDIARAEAGRLESDSQQAMKNEKS